MADAARLAVLVTAFAPMAFFFSAVYSESLYLALSVGLFWSARQGRWALVGVLGALAAATRSTGLVLLLPALMIYLYGPREDRAPDFARDARRRLLPRYRLRRDVLWLALLPLGVVVYAGVPRARRRRRARAVRTPRTCGAALRGALSWARGTA